MRPPSMRLAVIAAVVAVAVLLAVTLTAGAPDARGHAPDSSSSNANVRADLIDVSGIPSNSGSAWSPLGVSTDLGPAEHFAAPLPQLG